MDCAIVVVDAGFSECEAVAIAVIEVAAAWACFAVGLCHGVSCRVVVGPGNFCASFNRDIDWAEGEVFDTNCVSFDCRTRGII